MENYDKEYVINCIIPLFEFINTHDSIKESRTKEVRTDTSKKCEQKSDQSESRYQNIQKSRDGKKIDRSPLLSTQQKVSQLNAINQKETRMDYKKYKQLEKEDPTAETLALTNRWKKLAKPNDYKMKNGVWKKFNPPKFHRKNIKPIKTLKPMELHQKINRLIWKRMEQQSKDTPKKKADEKNCSQ